MKAFFIYDHDVAILISRRVPMRCLIVSILAVSLLVSAMPCLTAGEADRSPVRTFEGGKLYRSPGDNFSIAELHGNFRQMGRQYGNLLARDLKEMYGEVYENNIFKQPGNTFELAKQGADAFYQGMPQMLKEFVDGMSQTNGLGMDRTRIIAGTALFLPGSGCTSLSAWGDYTGRGPAVIGRNLDLAATKMGKYAKYLNVIVWNPEGYGHSVAHIDYLGGLFYQTAFNSKGIFLELENGQISDGKFLDNRQNTNHILLASLFTASSMKDMDMFFETVRPQTGLIMNVTSPEGAAVYEWATYRVVRRDGKGLISASNDFIDPSWKRYKVRFVGKKNDAAAAYTVSRRINLLNLGESIKGNVTVQAMMKILDTTIPEGGATFPDTGEFRTIYQVVAVPAQLKMWLKAPGYSGWEEIDLNRFFTKKP
jgi:hypothetical protein